MCQHSYPFKSGRQLLGCPDLRISARAESVSDSNANPENREQSDLIRLCLRYAPDHLISNQVVAHEYSSYPVPSNRMELAGKDLRVGGREQDARARVEL
jgi:hypothetical protein